ncbi:MAG: fumarate hydratase, partial [Devosia sp.]|nr:fumarate hydratase [Devosia sp.]
MAITYQIMKAIAGDLYDSSLRKVPEDTKAALARALEAESNPVARRVLEMMLESARSAEERQCLL